jgi:hypothetical protein
MPFDMTFTLARLSVIGVLLIDCQFVVDCKFGFKPCKTWYFNSMPAGK